MSFASANSKSLTTDGILPKLSSGISLSIQGCSVSPHLGTYLCVLILSQAFYGFLTLPTWYPESPFPYFLNSSRLKGTLKVQIYYTVLNNNHSRLK